MRRGGVRDEERRTAGAGGDAGLGDIREAEAKAGGQGSAEVEGPALVVGGHAPQGHTAAYHHHLYIGGSVTKLGASNLEF